MIITNLITLVYAMYRSIIHYELNDKNTAQKAQKKRQK